MTDTSDPFDLNSLRLPADHVVVEKRVEPRKIRERQDKFIKLPWTWVEKLTGAGGQTWAVAAHLLFMEFKQKTNTFKVANGMLRMDGVPAESKRRALRDLERRGLIAVQWRARKSPTVTLL